jgi:hypothetical protein
MRTRILLAVCFASALAGAPVCNAQVDPLDDLLGTEPTEVILLPNHMIPTQRVFWGEKGLMRRTDRFSLTPEHRQNELKLRRIMLTTHQALGIATMVGMIGQGIVGARLYGGDESMKDLHEGLAGAVNVTYFTTAGLSLFAPPGMLDERKGINSIKVHRALAVVHLSAMIATNILADGIEDDERGSSTRALHRAAAYTAFGSYAAAMIVIKF